MAVAQCPPPTDDSADEPYATGSMGLTYWEMYVIFDDFEGRSEGSVEIDGIQANGFTGCNCTYYDSKWMSADTIDSYYAYDSGDCFFYMDWTFGGPMQTLSGCMSGNCPTTGKVEVIYPDAQYYGFYVRVRSFL